MKRRRFSKSHGLFSVGLLLLLNTCYVAPSTNAAPTSVPTANHQQPVEGRFTSENIIRSIGFRECGSSPSLKPPTDSNSNAVRISNLALLYDEKTNKISLRVEGSTDHDFDATTGEQHSNHITCLNLEIRSTSWWHFFIKISSSCPIDCIRSGLLRSKDRSWQEYTVYSSVCYCGLSSLLNLVHY